MLSQAYFLIVVCVFNLDNKWQKIIINTFIGVLIISSIGILFIDQIMILINVEESIMHLVKTYSTIYILGLPFIGVYDVARAIIISLNNSKKSFYYMLSSSLLNIILDIVFIRYLHMGVAGAAIATVIAQIFVLCFTLRYLYKTLHKYPDFSLKPVVNKDDCIYLLRIALPSMLQQTGVTFMYLALQSFVNPFGEEIVSGYVAMSRIMGLFRQCIVAFSATIGVFSARFIASNDYIHLKESHRYVNKLSILFNIIAGMIFIFLNKQMAQLFFDIEIHQEAFIFFRTYLICSVFVNFTSAYKFIQESILRSALKMKEFIYSCMGDMIFRVIITYILIFMINDHAFWLGETLARTLGAIISGYYIIKYYKEISEV